MQKLFQYLTLLAFTISSGQYLYAEEIKKAKEETTIKEETAFKPFTGKIRGNKVRVRSGSDLDSPVISQLSKDELILVVGEKNNFYAIRPVGDTKVYVFRTYIIDNIVEADKVNIRLKPDNNSPILGQLKNKDQVLNATPYKKDSKWLEISAPENVCFYISKEYVSLAGDASHFALMKERKEEVSKLLNSAFFITQAECKKPFNEMDTKKAIAQFDAIIKGYSDFPEFVQQAKEGLALLQDNFLQKKIEYLETKANMAPEEKEEIFKEISSFKSKESEKKLSLSSYFASLNISSSMQAFSSLEEELYNSWSTFHPNKSPEDFYNEQKASAVKLSGTIAVYDQNIKNKPGDYIIKSDNAPIAYLYSIHVDLSKFVGKKVSVLVSTRPNKNFAFPAYYALSLE
jgi:hypothetical protein